MIQTKKELIDIIRLNEEKILSFGVRRLGLFGSFVRNEQDESSDVDFLVEFEKGEKTLHNLVGLHEVLAHLTNRKVEVVTKKGVSKYFKKRILNETEYVVKS